MSHLIDSHAHIYLPEFAEDRENILDRARSAGVDRIYMPAIDSGTHAAMLELEAAHPGFCVAMMGLHPCSVKEDAEAELKQVEDYLALRRFAAVGEIGLDFYWDKTYTEQQYRAFHRQIEWALHYDLPIVIHSREAVDACIAVVREHQRGSLRGVFHCFSGNEKQAGEITGLGFYLGIGGVATFKNGGLDKVLPLVSRDWLVLETDAPYLAPVPHRGKRNEPAYLPLVVQRLALIYGCDAEEIARVTTQNAQKLFGPEAPKC